MRQLFSKKRSNSPARATGPFVAVDFDRSTMRIVLARPGKLRCEIEKLVLVGMPDQLNLNDGTAIGAVLAKAMRDASIKVSTLVMAVPRAQAVLKPLSLPNSTDMGELAAMVLLQVDGQLPFPTEEAVIDFAAGARDEAEPTRPAASPNAVDAKRAEAEDAAAQTIEVLAAAVQQQVVAKYSGLALAAGLKLSCLTLRPYANAACLSTVLSALEAGAEKPDASASPERVRALVTLASEEVETTILVDGHVIFSRSATLPSGPSTSVEAAASQTLRALQSYQALHADRRVTSVHIAGGTGVEAELARRVADAMKVNASLLEPQRSMQLPDVSSAGEKGDPLAFTSALGLALAFGSPDPTLLPFDFINPKRPTQPHETSRTTRSLVALTFVTAVCCVIGLCYISLQHKQREAERLEAQAASLEKDVKRVATFSKRLDAIDNWTKKAVDPLSHWANLSALFPPAQDAFITGLHTDNDGRILFTTRARNQQVVDVLAPRFTEHGYLPSPGSVATRGDSPDAPGYAFTTDVKLVTSLKQKIDVDTLSAPPRPADDSNAPQPTKKETPAPGSATEEHPKPRSESGNNEGGNNTEGNKGERWRKNHSRGNGQGGGGQ